MRIFSFWIVLELAQILIIRLSIKFDILVLNNRTKLNFAGYVVSADRSSVCL